MVLENIIRNSGVTEVKGCKDIQITSICSDSRKVAEGSLFIAVKGFDSDGHDYIDAAVAAGDPELANWNVKAYPKPQTQMEMILEMLGSGTASEEQALLKLAKDFTKPQVVARLPYNIVIR